MTMRYANRADVLVQLELEDDLANSETIARLERMENGIADAFDQKIGRTFGVVPVAQTRLIEVRRCDAVRLILPTGIRSVSAIDIDGDWDGTAWVDGETVPINRYRLTLQDHDGIYWGIERVGDGWSHWTGTMRVTGIWNDQIQVTVPDDVREAVNFLVCDEWRLQKTSPAGEIGPDGMTIQIRNPWTFDRVKTAIARHKYEPLVA